MGCSIVTTFFLTIGVYFLLQHQHHSLVRGAPTSDVATDVGGNLVQSIDRARAYGRPMLIPRVPNSRSAQYMRNHLVPLESHNTVDDFVLDDEDVVELNKRQSEDYGHMRFGKRGDKFDDYGHMRFGRGLEG